ncbi:rhodanese-like domain-containing protein [Lactobacillus sp. YT155]|uniref:rhodanese-like domain-containing protein n=1 Tax=Lactobacillus sp. YT155 TaxID=3060955 RepID=UPI00265E3386|nr:rhodanese-like domain-containing protein [Lactobacillus sp. YT155]MDO1605573.1 rhodanese-like domain-containing protein [Lactobacillus sp. YT155]
MMNFIYALDAVLVAFLLYWGAKWLYYRYKAKQLNGAMEPEDFESTMRKAQLIDIREKDEYDSKHILGARNLPYSQMKMYAGELRKDLPVYVYGRTVNSSIGAVNKLRKYGFQDIHWLKQDFKDWKGKTKKTTKL